jgi:hypothetical protein
VKQRENGRDSGRFRNRAAPITNHSAAPNIAILWVGNRTWQRLRELGRETKANAASD